MKQFKSFFGAAIWVAAQLARAQVVYNSIPTQIAGQAVLQQQGTLTAIAPNLVEGRELNSPQAVALDTSVTPPILYVADTNNSRVLAWKNAGPTTKGTPADLVIGQRYGDFLSTSAQGPGNSASSLSTGVGYPTALAVDSGGNLYVADTLNNRILRYPAPFQQQVAHGALLASDLIIGQHDLSGSSANEGQSAPSAKTLALLSGSGPFRAGLAFDAQGNLWASDPGNNRVLRFPVANLAANTVEPQADLVLGQADFVSSSVPSVHPQTGKNFLVEPAGLAFDPEGRLFVADLFNRVVVYTPGYASGQNASRIMGVIPATAQNPNPPSINAATLGSTNAPPSGVFFVGNNPWVVDTGNARILGYASYDQWPAETTAFSPSAIAVLGQSDFLSNSSNQAKTQPNASTLSGPVNAHLMPATEVGGAASAISGGGNLYVADGGNNRVLIFPQQSSGGFPGAATGVLGQADFPYNSVNLIEGREFYFQNYYGSLVVDWNSAPPHLYVSDPGNNRVLGFLDYRTVHAGQTADLVIGQPNLYTGMLNYPNNDPDEPTNQGLFQPQGLALDANGNLWVADSGNGRVLRYPSPFSQANLATQLPNLVIGQAGFSKKVTDPSSTTMHTSYGIAFTALGHLLVSDPYLDRILFFLKPSGGDFTNGQAATSVIGQPNFGTPSENTLSSPHLITVDTDDRLFVADSGNNRIVIYQNVPSAGNDPAPSFSLTGLSDPLGVFADLNTNQIWVANSGGGQVLRYPKFDTLVTNPAPDVTLTSFAPVAVTLDPFDNPIVAEAATNRVAFFYPQIDVTDAAGGVTGRFSGNAANYFQRFAPGMIATIFAYQNTHFGVDTAVFSSTPVPTTLGDVQVLVNGVASPLFYASPPQINFLVPSATPVGPNPIEFTVLKASTGQILATAFFRIDAESPGLFSADATGAGQLAAINVADGTINSGTHPAKAGTYISLYGTGPGVIQGAPPDGTPVASGQLPTTSSLPQVYINGVQLASSDIQYSGLAPGFVGLWQINCKIPANVPTPDIPVPVAVVYQDINSREDQYGNQRTTTIRTTP